MNRTPSRPSPCPSTAASVARAATLVAIALALPGLADLGCGAPPASEPWPWESQTWPARTAFELTIEGRPVRLELERNDALVAPDYEAYVVDASGALVEDAHAEPPPACFYRGRAVRADGDDPGAASGDYAALGLCAGPDGQVVVDGIAFALTPGARPDEVLVRREADRDGAAVATALTRVDAGPMAIVAAPLVRAEKYLELAVYNDLSRGTPNSSTVEAHTFALINALDANMRRGELTPGLGVYLRAQVTFNAGVPFASATDGSGRTDPASLLAAFAAWQPTSTYAPGVDAHALLTELPLANSSLGVAQSGSVCRPGYLVAAAPVSLPTPTQAAALTHELGVVLGLPVDDGAVGSACPLVGNFMSSLITTNGAAALSWSPCSAAAFADLFATRRPDRDLSCLDAPPGPLWAAPRCGNGVVEPNEQCDCRTPEGCAADPCCDGATCRFKPGATCSLADACCDPGTCAPVVDGRTCREADGACALATACDNHSAQCPPERFVAAGTACDDGLSANGGRCFEGECVSRPAQCKAVDTYLPVALDGLVACAVAGVGSSCSALACGTNGNALACTTVVDHGETLAPYDGSACGPSSQCVDGACVASASQPLCADGGAPNACGGCGELAHTPGTPCLDCGTWTCQGRDGLVCSGCGLTWDALVVHPCMAACDVETTESWCTDGQHRYYPDAFCEGVPNRPPMFSPCGAEACAAWVVGAWSSCANGQQTRSALCRDGRTTEALLDAACAAAGPKPAPETRASVTNHWVGTRGACQLACGDSMRGVSWRCEDGRGLVVPDEACT
ncbi:MAG: reprolysin family propeptide-containing metallopeptidase, partial [Myxococcota bacterium]